MSSGTLNSTIPYYSEVLACMLSFKNCMEYQKQDKHVIISILVIYSLHIGWGTDLRGRRSVSYFVKYCNPHCKKKSHLQKAVNRHRRSVKDI